ncbi:hypothetical protein ACRAWD_28565 [Caulobacter segnis]
MVDPDGESAHPVPLVRARRLRLFVRFPMPRKTELFAPTSSTGRGRGTALGRHPLAIRATAATGRIAACRKATCRCAAIAWPSPSPTGGARLLGGLFFGHPEPGRFSTLRRRPCCWVWRPGRSPPSRVDQAVNSGALDELAQRRRRGAAEVRPGRWPHGLDGPGRHRGVYEASDSSARSAPRPAARRDLHLPTWSPRFTPRIAPAHPGGRSAAIPCTAGRRTAAIDADGYRSRRTATLRWRNARGRTPRPRQRRRAAKACGSSRRGIAGHHRAQARAVRNARSCWSTSWNRRVKNSSRPQCSRSPPETLRSDRRAGDSPCRRRPATTRSLHRHVQSQTRGLLARESWAESASTALGRVRRRAARRGLARIASPSTCTTLDVRLNPASRREPLEHGDPRAGDQRGASHGWPCRAPMAAWP